MVAQTIPHSFGFNVAGDCEELMLYMLYFDLKFYPGAFFISAQPSAAFFLTVAEGSVVWL